MRKLFFFLFLLGVVFGGSFAAARFLSAKKQSGDPSLQGRFQPTPFPLKNHPFAIVIVAFNNGASVAKTLASVFSQNYELYRVIYIDDASDDGSFDLARDLIYDSDHLGQVELVRNEKRLGDLANLSRAVRGCQDEEIVVVLQGEDWLAHEWVLQKLNGYYANPALWLTFGQYRDFPSYQPGVCKKEDRESLFRAQPFTASHLHTFYASLFKKIHESDFMYGGQFFPSCADLAYMIPMLEMAKNHFHRISETLYIRNRQQAVHVEDKELEALCEKMIRALDPYPEILSLQVKPCGS